MKKRLLTIMVAALVVSAPASAAQRQPRVTGKSLLGFCSGDPS